MSPFLSTIRRILWVAAFSAFCGLSGCHTPPISDTVVGPEYEPSNVFAAQARLPEQLRRVAVLPLTSPPNDPIAASGGEALQPVLQSELAKTGKFEIVQVTPGQLRQWIGRSGLTGEEALPPGLLTQIGTELGCDAVLFGRLSQYRPYRPPAVGWNFKLADCREGRVWWALDDIFDGGDFTVVNSARRYYQRHIQAAPPLADSFSILSSPRLFAQYTLHAAFATLPSR